MMLLVLAVVQRACVVVAESCSQRLVLQQRPYAVGVAGVGCVARDCHNRPEL